MTALTFTTAGTVTGLYTEIIPLHQIGSLSVNRLSNVEFNERAQRWEVRDQSGAVVFHHESRQTCLDWEIEHFN